MSIIQAQRNSAKTHPELTKISKLHDRHCCGISVVKSAQVTHSIQQKRDNCISKLMNYIIKSKIMIQKTSFMW